MKRFIAIAAMIFLGVLAFSTNSEAITIKEIKPGEDVFKYIHGLKVLLIRRCTSR